MSSNTSNNITISRIDSTESQSPDSFSETEIDLIEFTLCTRYAEDADPGKFQFPLLHELHDPKPDSARYVGPIYPLTDQQVDRLDDFRPPDERNPYSVESHSIATELQNECEEDGRVLYRINIESDAMDNNVDPSTIVNWTCEFIRDRLSVAPDDCTFYFSGNRSIHCHVPRFIYGQYDLRRFGSLVEEFNKEHEAQLDTSIYAPKSQFRMSGVIHAGTGNKKIQINPDSPNRDIAQAIDSSNAEYPDSPSTYIGQLNSVFEEDLFPTRALSTDLLWLPTEEENTNVGDSIPTPLLERERPPFGASSPNDWEAYNLWHFSPYSNTGGENSRGWAVVQIHGPAFCRPEYDKRIRVPCYFYYALSGNDEFTKEGECAPLAPGKDGYRKLVKLDVDVGDHLVVIGSRNRKSKILVIPEEDTFAAVYLAEHDRESARDYLEAQGYDVGSPGLQESSYSSRSSLQSPTSTEAGRLQRKAETDDIHLLSHLEHLKVACRLLQIDGYNPTRNWFERQYGPDFNPTETDRQLRHIANTYDNLPNPPAR